MKKVILSLASIFVIFSYVAFQCRPDPFTAFTIVPAWCVFVVGLLSSAAIGWRVPKAGAALSAVWLLFLLLFAEEPYAILDEERSETGLKIVSLNWGGASQQPVPTLKKLNPDLLFIQEAPRKDVLSAISEQLGDYSLIWSPEAAILSKEPLKTVESDVHYVRARQDEMDLVSLRLSPPLVRFDFYNPQCWLAYWSRRIERRHQIESVLEGPTLPTIVAGDFNAPAGDGCLGPLLEDFHDAYGQAGRGFGNTAPSYFPVHRIDQIWIRNDYQAKVSFTVRIPGSDHRAAVAVFEKI